MNLHQRSIRPMTSEAFEEKQSSARDTGIYLTRNGRSLPRAARNAGDFLLSAAQFRLKHKKGVHFHRGMGKIWVVSFVVRSAQHSRLLALPKSPLWWL